MSTHTDVTCDGCKVSPIVGTRWKCLGCHNWDFCDKCKTSVAHDPSHKFLEITAHLRRPRDDYSNVQGQLCEKCTKKMKGGVAFCCMCGNCARCDRMISYSAFKLCGECSNELKHCYMCAKQLNV